MTISSSPARLAASQTPPADVASPGNASSSPARLAASQTPPADVASESPAKTIRCFDPATLEPLGDVPASTPDEVRERVARARRAQAAWGRTSFDVRRRVLGRLLDHVLAHADELVDVIVRDSGKTRENAMLGEIWPICEKIRNTVASGEKHLRAETVSAGLFAHKQARVEYQPLGVIGVICPWNYPLQNVMGPTIPALFAGNAVVIKVSEWTSWSARRFQQIFDEAFEREGLPADLVQIVCGYGDAGAALVSSGADKIIFTGSMANGRRVVEESAKTLVPLILELGGKDAFVVCDDADIEQSAHAALAGVFIAAGQNCLAAERFFVFDAVYDRFVDRVRELAGGLRQGPPRGAPGEVDIGAMTTPPQIDVVTALVDDAVSRGARVLAGGKRSRREGSFFEPTILVDVPADARILHEETFGPVMVILRVANEEEAVRRANESQFGLSATVMTKSRARAERLARDIVSGGTSHNDFGLPYMAMDLPFGGVRGSGYGRLNGREGLRACCNAKAVLYDRMPFGMPAKLYPVGRFDYDMARGAIRLLYERGVRGKLGAVTDLARTAARSIRKK